MGMVAAMAVVLAMAAVPAAAATVETAASAAVAATTIVTTAASAAITPAAERPLEARAGVSANAGRLARELALRFVADVRCARFAGEKESALFRRRDRGRDLIPFFLGGFWLVRFGFEFFVHRLGIVDDVLTKSGDVQRVFVRGIGFRFGNGLRSAYDLLDGRLVGRFLRVFFLVKFDFFFVLFDFFLKDAAAGRGVCFNLFADQILLGVDDACGKIGRFVFAEVDVGTLGSERGFIFRVNIGLGGSAYFLFFRRRNLGSLG